MEIALLIEKILATTFLILGFSVLMNKDQWISYIKSIKNSSHPNPALGLLGLFLGSILIYSHNIWSGSPTTLLVTLLGWIVFIKHILYFTLPSLLFKLMPKNERLYLQIMGPVMILLGIYILFNIFSV